jgi:hypothetical protein
VYAETNDVPFEIPLQPLRAAAFPRTLMGSENLRFQSGLLPCPVGGRAFAPCVITADRNT